VVVVGVIFALAAVSWAVEEWNKRRKRADQADRKQDLFGS
jgi:hypothetical protein